MTETERSNIPRPDPSELTTEQLLREIAGLKELMAARFDAMEKATALRLEIADRIPQDTRAQVSHLRELHAERFTSIAGQFTERDIRTEQASAAGAQALAAALQAAKELVGSQGEATAAAAVKSETSFTKQIDQIGTIIQTLEKALDARITELKERIDRGEGSDRGARDTRIEYRENSSDTRAGNGQTIAIASAALVLVSVLVAVLALVLR